MIFSFLKTEVSKSRDTGGLTVGIDTIRAPRAEPPPETLLTPRVALAMRGFRVFDTTEENPRLDGASWVLDADDNCRAERAGEKEEVAADIEDWYTEQK